MDYCRLPIAVLLLLTVCRCSGLPDAVPANILAFLPTEARSHFTGFKPLLEALVARGHNLTLVSPFPLSSEAEDGSPLQYTHVQVEMSKHLADMNHLDPKEPVHRVPVFVLPVTLGPMIATKTLDKPAVREFVARDRGPYDVVMFENFMSECFVALGHKYGAPVVQLLSIGANSRVSQWHGNPYAPAYIADHSGEYAAPMTFAQRAFNTAAAAFNTIVGRLAYVPRQRAIMAEHFASYPGHEGRPDLETMLRHVALTLANSHPLLSSVAPLVPGYVPVAGMHVRPAGPLPQDLQTIMDGSERGVVYFSLGSVVKSSKMPRQTVSMLLSELAKIEQTVLWKWEDDRLPELPKNVIVRKWFPQNDILAHPNCRLFITHGGIHSLIEAIYHGVPMLSVPVFGDQKHNSAQAESRGFALYVSYFQLTAETFGAKLREVLRNPRFKESVSRASAIMRDNPMSIMDRAVFWIEYVIRHKGAPHLRTAANDLYWFQLYLLDVIAAVSLATALALYTSYKCFSYALRKIRAPKSSSSSSVTPAKRDADKRRAKKKQ